MKLRKLLIISGIILFISGCSEFMMICSLNPFYLDKNIVLAPEIEGNWSAHQIQSKKDSTDNNSSHWEMADTLSTWSISQRIFQETRKTKQGKDSTVFKPQNDYVVKLVGSNPNSAKYQFSMVIFKINDVIYADFSPYELTAIKRQPDGQRKLLYRSYIGTDYFSREAAKNIVARADYMKGMIENKRVRIKYRYVPNAGRLLLTASSEDLTEMIERYADQKRFIDWDDQPAMLKLTLIN